MSVVLSANEAADAPEEVREKTILGLTPDGWLRILAPALIGFLALAGWEWAVRAKEIPSYILPGPIEIGRTLLADWGTLSGSLLITLQITFAALFVARDAPNFVVVEGMVAVALIAGIVLAFALTRKK